MMAAFNALFLLILFVVTFLVIAAIVYGVLRLFGLQRKRRWIAATFVVYCCCIGVDGYLNTRPAVVFERQFGFPPSSDVINMKSSQWILGDSGRIRLSFYASQETFDRIISRGMERMPDVGKSQHFHREFSEYFGSEFEDVYFNASTGRFSYHWSGVD